ncbi:response regulator receiver domain [Micromonospora aurantiaca (nom. illeg.)]|uniref:response regulator receiver domain n=1 Tax=Micromonospora aurantiaca (nom. illeg.) TaxID=47850 RepID=UPI003EBB4773
MTAAQVPPPHPVDHAKDFFELCRRAAQEFLQTIVVVDDRATYGRPDVVTTLDSPDYEPVRDIDEFESEFSDHDLGSGSSLDVSALTDASADIGLTCAVLRPEFKEQHDGTLDRRLTNVAKRADVLVLDWQLNDETRGEAALRLLQEVAADDDRQPARLRLVCIYTSDPNLNGVYEAVRGLLGSSLSKCSDPTGNEWWLSCGYLRVVILSKAGSSVPSHTGPSTIVSESELPRRLLAEFTYLTAGLVSNVAVAALAAVRQDAHRLLTRFPIELDPAFLSHRFFEGGPESEDLLVRLVADEIKSVLDGADIRRWVSASAVRLWGEDHVPQQKDFHVKGRRTMSRGDLLEILEKDSHDDKVMIDNSSKSGDQFDLKKLISPSITKVLTQDEARAREMDYDFSRLTCLSRNDAFPFPAERTPTLTEGTIIRGRVGDKGIYLLCAMPLCDTVRIRRDARAFPFVPLELASAEGRYNLVARSPEGERLYLAFSSKNHYDIVRHNFSGDATGVVRAKRSKTPKGDRFVFVDASSKPWIWIGELRFAHAHRKLNEMGAASSRVGLDESHVLRIASGS